MIEEAKDLLNDIKDKVGEKGFYLIIFALVGVGIYLVMKGNNDSDYYAPTGVTGYPDVGANADVVMDSINNTLEGALGEFGADVNSRFDYMESVFGEIDNNINASTGEIINNSNANTNAIISNSNQNKQDIISSVTEVTELVSKVENTENVTQSYVPESATVLKSTAPKTETIQYTTQSGLNTSTSIVDALKASGQDSSFAARSELAAVNGISNYTGSYDQNVTLLNKMKSGQLKAANSQTTTKANNTATTQKTTTATTPKTTTTSTQKLNTSTSIVDALKAQGKDSSFSARKKMAESLGIKNYTGTAAQNVQLLKSL